MPSSPSGSMPKNLCVLSAAISGNFVITYNTVIFILDCYSTGCLIIRIDREMSCLSQCCNKSHIWGGMVDCYWDVARQS